MKHWPERFALQLIAELVKVEDAWGGPEEWVDEDEKWSVVAAELPHLASDLGFPENEREEIPKICKGKFHDLCWDFNVAVEETPGPKRIHKSLTVKVMAALKLYAFRENPPRKGSPGTSLGEHAPRKIIIPYSRIPCRIPCRIPSDEEYSDDSADSGISDESTADQLTIQDTTESQTLEAPVRVPPSDAEEWKPQVFILRLKERDFKVGFHRVPLDFEKIYSAHVEPVFFICIYNGNTYKVKYLPSGKVFSGGWKKFVRENSFETNDMLVFSQLDHTTFQVTAPGVF